LSYSRFFSLSIPKIHFMLSNCKHFTACEKIIFSGCRSWLCFLNRFASKFCRLHLAWSCTQNTCSADLFKPNRNQKLTCYYYSHARWWSCVQFHRFVNQPLHTRRTKRNCSNNGRALYCSAPSSCRSSLFNVFCFEFALYNDCVLYLPWCVFWVMLQILFGSKWSVE